MTKNKVEKEIVPIPPQPEGAAVDIWGAAEDDDGFEGAGSEEISIPFLSLAQALSQSVDEGMAEVGQLFIKSLEIAFNTATFIPVVREHVFGEWIPQDDGGGLVSMWKPDDPFVKEAIRANRGDTYGLRCGENKEHDLISTFHLYTLLVPEGEMDYIRTVIPFSGSKLKPYRAFFNSASNLKYDAEDGTRKRCPLWSHEWNLASKKEMSKKTGKPFLNLHINLLGDSQEIAMLQVGDGRIAAALEFRRMIMANMAIPDITTVDSETTEKEIF